MRFVLGIFLALLLIVSANAQQSLKIGDAAPTFSASSLDGQLYDLNNLKGKVVVLTFWSTRCNICHSEIPKLNKLADRFKGQDVVFLGLTMDNEAKVQSYLRSTPFQFNIVPNGFGVVLQYADRDKQGNIDMGFPAYYVLNQTGSLEYRASGWDKTPNLDSNIGRLLSSAKSSDQASQSAGAGLK
jgi:peroxiredoxin